MSAPKEPAPRGGTATSPWSHPLRVADLAGRKPTRFDLRPEPAVLMAIAEELGIERLRKLSFKGELTPRGRNDWVLEATLGATVVQACIVSLAPVTTRIDETVRRQYLADMRLPDGDEVEMPEDDTIEPLPAVIDAGEVMIEALALALPLYPRAEEAGDEEPAETLAAPPGAAPIAEETLKPFAGLAALLKKDEDTPPGGA